MNMEAQHLTSEIERADVRLFSLGGTPITLFDLGFVVVALILLLVFTSLLQRLVAKRLMARSHLDPGTREALGSLVRYVTLVIGFMVIMQAAGINLTAFGFLVGAVGVGVGFGLQNIISNFISGIVVMVERPVKPGDRVEVAGTEGSVLEIGARATTLLTNDNVAAIVPNQKLITETVKNWRHGDGTWQLRVALAIKSDSDPQAARAAMLAIAAANADVLQQPAPVVRLTSLAGGSLTLEMRIETSLDVLQHADVVSALHFALLEELGRRGVHLA
jgi:small-conductance mechanosensitive channel